ncbi:SDR family NAD(P)-dependent oxidoreductase [Candidatus Pacearchaeota archaeon]|nr:SDR family NAD(P)-dependent oxidoreductase [Candidatus Pacearchaeota archaeon]
MVNKKALITGASSGIGLEFVRALSKEYDITLVSNEKDKLNKIVNELVGNHKFIYADLTDFKDIKRICDEISNKNYNLVINNAGMGIYGDFAETPIDKLNEVITINCNAIMMISHSFLKKAKPGDSLIIVSSAIVFLPSSNGPIYVSTKAFNSLLGQCLWHKQRKRGVYVMTLHPGVTNTGFFNKSGVNKLPPKSIMQSSEEVVKIAVRELNKRKKPIVVTGIKNKFFIFLTRFLPRKTIINFMERF